MPELCENERIVIQQWKKMLMETLPSAFPQLTPKELSDAIDYSIIKRCKNPNVVINNNYKNKKVNTTVLDLLDDIYKNEPIVSSSGVLFLRHDQCENPLSEMIQGFLIKRKRFKKEMFKYPKGTADFAKYNLKQLLEKRNANAVYGCLGQCTCMYYNIYIAEAITRQGRSYISCSMMLFESLLANNVKFNSANEIIVFLYNIVTEKNERRFRDCDILDENITVESVFYKVMNTVDTDIWIPTEVEMNLIWEYMITLSQWDLNRIWYKNSIYDFCNNTYVKGLIIDILNSLNNPFMNPNDPPKEIKEKLEYFTSLIYEFVYYHYFVIDKLDRIEYMKRDIVCITDTDSCIISFDAWYRFVLDIVKGINLPILYKQYNEIDIIESGNDVEACNFVNKELDYNFYTEEVYEVEKAKTPKLTIPQENLKYSIINMIAYVCSKIVIDYLSRYTQNTGSYREGVPCRMVMKNEYYFGRLLLTEKRRNYANYQVIQEGNIIPEDSRLGIAGLPINKSTLSEGIKAELQDILLNEIMVTPEIDQKRVMKKLVILEKKIYNAIMAKSTEYYKPDNVAPISSYSKSPLSVNGVRACIIYNKLKDDDLPAINLEERNYITKIKIKVDAVSAEKIRDKYPETYEKLIAALKDDDLKGKIDVIAIPLDSTIPDWVLEFVDFEQIINDNLSNFPLESIGIKRINSAANYTNIISL